MRSPLPCSDSSATPSSPSQLGWMIGLPWPNIRGSLKSPCNSRIPPQLEKNHVAPPSSQDEALGRYSVSREVSRSVLSCETVPDTLHATSKISQTCRIPSRGTPRFPAPPHLCPFSPPDRDRRVDSPALSARASDIPGAPKDEAGLIRKFKT